MEDSKKTVRTNHSLGHIPELDGLRGIAVGLVLVKHFWPNAGFLSGAAPLADLGWIGVDVFFVLSGFLITGILLDSIGQPDYYRRFYKRRAFRIFPLYYAFLLLMFLFLVFWHQGLYLQRLQREWGSPLWFVVYLANFVMAYSGKLIPFGPLGMVWSLQIEEQFYLFFPFLVRRLGKRLWLLLVGMMTVALAWRILLFLIAPENSLAPYVGTLSRVDSLAAGGLAAYLIRLAEKNEVMKIVAWLTPLSIGAMVAMYCIVGTEIGNPVTRTVGYSLNAIAFAALILWIVDRRNGLATLPFRLGPIRWLGKISYGVYLLQLPVQSAVKVMMGIPLGSFERTAGQSTVWLVATLVVAWLSWRLFEKPLLNWGTK
jgi:peptidoglycan/LPS O-acetylase OafA/YrhL